MRDLATHPATQRPEAMDRVISAFTEDQASRLARVSVRQLRYWNRVGFFAPSISLAYGDPSVGAVYSFDDVVGLRVLGELRNHHAVSLQHLRRIRDHLRLPQETWAAKTVYVLGRKVYFENEIGGYTNAETGEDTLPHVPITAVLASVAAEAAQLRSRGQTTVGGVSRTRSVARNAEVFAGTRIPIAVVREFVEEGLTTQDILDEYPTLTADDIEAAIRHLGLQAA